MQKRSLFPVIIFLVIGVLASSPLLSVMADDSSSELLYALTPAPEETFQAENSYFTNEEITLPDGRQVEQQVINGPPRPPEAYLAQRTAVTSLDRSATILPDFPSYSWVFGCSAVSGAMIAGYYDRSGYPELYTGPTNGGLMPLTDTSWPSWTDGSGDSYPGNPLVASKSGLDGRTTRGSIEDYWVEYGSTATDPYITSSWTQHTWGTAIGDFMKTSQSKNYNVDGSTNFSFTGDGTKLSCTDMEKLKIGTTPVSKLDGTYGRKLFYEARGYIVGECYNQESDNQATLGFSIENFKAEIDAGHPVLLNLQYEYENGSRVGHSVVGYGYDGENVYYRDTWDSDPSHIYKMPWDGCLQIGGEVCMGISMVSVVKLQTPPLAVPGGFGKDYPINNEEELQTTVSLSWSESNEASGYEVCLKAMDDGTCTEWLDNGTSTSKDLPELEEGTTYFWQVRAYNDGAYTYADGSPDAFWQFSTDIDPPGDFDKINPINGDTELNLPVTLTWSSSVNASFYEVCYATSEAGCTNWKSAGGNTSFVPSGMQSQTTYYWQVRAVNIADTTYADGNRVENYWTFTTDKFEQIYLPMISRD